MSDEDTIDADRYRAAGVDIDAGARLVDAIRPLASATARPGSDGGADAGLGGFGGLFDLAAAGFHDPVLVAATDGVGTKLKVAVAAARHHGVGVDLVAMCVNDLVVQGAEPLFFLDYFATGQLDVAAATEVVAGIARGCQQAGCALIGGETAEMPGMYAPGDYDLAGFAVGAVERGAILTGATIEAGDTVLGLPASGLHANGFSLVRQVVEDAGTGWREPAPFAPERTLGEALLEPTRIYVRPCLAAIRETGAVRGLAHITGGGLVENIPRILPAGLGAELDGGAWRAAPVFGWLAETGGIAAADMLRTFNCGLGMVAICAAEGVGAVQRALATGDVRAVPVGRIVAAGDGPRVRVGNAEAAWR